MAPARSNRREQPGQPRNPQPDDPTSNDAPGSDLFLEPMMGTPLTVYIEKDVDERESLVQLITVRIPPLDIPILIRGALPSETWRRRLPRLQWHSLHSWYVLDLCLWVLPYLILSSRSPQGVGPKLVSPICWQEGKDRPSLSMGTRMHSRRHTSILSKQLGRLQSDRHGKVHLPFLVFPTC